MSIIIPCRSVDMMAKECVKRCNELDYPSFEVLLLPDAGGEVEGARVVQTGPATPGHKRNVGASATKGDVLAYIDADAYPRHDWLANAVKHLEGDGVGAVGGPGLTPREDGAFAAVQDSLLSSYLVGALSSRYKQVLLTESDDIHSVNFVAWRTVVEKVGGWDEHYWPGEDTLICLAIKKAGYRQLLSPDIVVYHHRRPTLRSYLRQIGSYGTHRGFFAKRFPETSRRLRYFAPSLLVFGFVALALLVLVNPLFGPALLFCLILYLVPVMLLCLKSEARLFPVILIGVPLTHFVYGMSFVRGLLLRRLPR